MCGNYQDIHSTMSLFAYAANRDIGGTTNPHKNYLPKTKPIPFFGTYAEKGATSPEKLGKLKKKKQSLIH